MGNVIFYFSGTGNTLAAVRDIANEIGNTKLVSIADAMKENNIELTYDRIGLAFPVYFSSVPDAVKRFIKKLYFEKSQYIFSIITFGGSYGMALSQLSKCIEEHSGVLSAGFPVRMPGNYIDKYNAWPEVIQRIVFKRADKKIKDISIMIREKRPTRIPEGSIFSRLSEGYVNKVIASFGDMAVNFHTNNKCNGCEICRKVCPVGNIDIIDKRPHWGKKCEHCVACIQWCPAKAIEYANKTQNRKQYRHPKIKASDLFSEKL